MKTVLSLGMLLTSLLPLAAQADELQPGDTAWVMISSALVLFMVLPGLALFYAGLVRRKNVLSVLMQCFMVTCVASVAWMVLGYSMAFTGDGPHFGGFDRVFLAGIVRDTMSGSIPESIFVMFQLTFAAITPALIVGGFAERMRFSAILLFTLVWSLLIYYPIAHQVWGGGWLASLGILDFAGGMVVHLTAGTAALVAALVLGPRRQFPKEPMPPHNLTLTATGAGMLWVGWFGFNGGSALAANGDAAMAILVTQICTAAAVLTWAFLEWARRGKPSLLGAATGVIVGLVAITPACGFVSPLGALIIGVAASLVSYFALYLVKTVWQIDDSLDVFPVHGVTGALGSILTGLFASEMLGGVGFDGTMLGQLGVQALGTGFTFVYTLVVTYLCLKAVGFIFPLRIDEEAEVEGIDLSQQGERGYNL